MEYQNNEFQINDTQNNDTRNNNIRYWVLLSWLSFVLTVVNKYIMLSHAERSHTQGINYDRKKF